MGSQGYFLRQPEKLSGVRVDCNLDLHDTENPDILHAMVTRFINPPTVTSPIPPYPPVCDFVGTPLTGQAPLVVQFTDLSLNNPTLWRWYFEPEWFPVEEQNPVHVFAAPGTFTVGLYVTNEYGEAALTKSDYITVTAPPPPPAVCVNYFSDPGFEDGGADWHYQVISGSFVVGPGFKHSGNLGAQGIAHKDLTWGPNGSPLYFWNLGGVGRTTIDYIDLWYKVVDEAPPAGGDFMLWLGYLEYPVLPAHWVPIPISDAICDWTYRRINLGFSAYVNQVYFAVASHNYPATPKFEVWVDDFNIRSPTQIIDGCFMLGSHYGWVDVIDVPVTVLRPFIGAPVGGCQHALHSDIYADGTNHTSGLRELQGLCVLAGSKIRFWYKGNAVSQNGGARTVTAQVGTGYIPSAVDLFAGHYNEEIDWTPYEYAVPGSGEVVVGFRHILQNTYPWQTWDPSVHSHFWVTAVEVIPP